MKAREIELYAVLHRDFDVNNIDHWWCARFMRDRKYKIEHDVPFIDFDFELLSAHLLNVIRLWTSLCHGHDGAAVAVMPLP